MPSPSMVAVDDQQVDGFADLLPALGRVKAFDFCGNQEGVLFPPVHHPGALDAFFFNAAHQFGFWYLREGRYDRPMIAKVGGLERKGSDYLFFCTQRALHNDPGFFAPEKLDALTEAERHRVFQDDDGNNPLPMWEEHLRILMEYPKWFIQTGVKPVDLVGKANAATNPLAVFLEMLAGIPGYGEDPLRKKAMLLAVILENRPEHFLRVTDPESAVPIIDYHLQRSALRTGLIRIEDENLRAKVEQRILVTAAEESVIRQATFEAIQRLVDRSGLSVAAVDYFFFTNRTRCPEMTTPLCHECPVQRICRQKTGFFQPVFRTSYY